jgi:homoaconitate hydratase family protein/3-isopropylmalate dehydratase small subunit
MPHNPTPSGASFAQKALARAAGLPRVEIGQTVDVRPHRVLSHDNSAAIIRTFRDLGISRVREPDRLIIALDHAVPAPTAQHAMNHAEIRQFVAEQEIEHFFEAGRGICHQVASEEALIQPGQTILGADSHTTHFGWLGAFGAGIGRSEAAALWATGELWLRVPETIRIALTGMLPEGVTTKDLSIWLLRTLGREAGIYRALEFGGPGLARLSVESRMVLPNMMAESGAKSAYVTPDPGLFEWLAPRWAVRSGHSKEECLERLAEEALYPDADAPYVLTMEVDLGTLEPIVSCPHDPADGVPLSEVAGTPVHQAFIGTCTNGRLEDLAEAAAVLRRRGGKARRVAKGTRLLVIPASSEVLREAIAAGYVDVFLEAGAMLGTPGCGPCMGNHLGVPATGETVISSANRNFRGRMGNAESDVYLASPAVVAASAVRGRITDPRDLLVIKARAGDSTSPGDLRRQTRRQITGGSHAAGEARRTLGAEANLRSTVRPLEDPEDSTRRQRRGTIAETELGEVRAGSEHSHMPGVISGRAWVYGDDVNTDVIFPGKYTYTVRERSEMAPHALEDLDPEFASGVRQGDVIVAGRNWGCGSSREQAVTCLLAAGVSAIVGRSFARIYYRNAVNNGLLPVVCPEAVDAIQPGETVSVDLRENRVRCMAGTFAFQPYSESVQRIIEAGGLSEMLRKATPER